MSAQHANSEMVTKMITDIRSGKAGRDRVLTTLYKDKKLKESILNMVYKMGGSKDDFHEIYTTTLMQFVKTVIQKRDVSIQNDLYSYMAGIARYLWIAYIKKNKTLVYSGADITMEEWAENPENLVIYRDKIDLLSALMNHLGNNCKEVLMHWAHGYKMKEIADMMQYKSEGMAKKKKYQCFKALVSYIEQNPEIKEALRK